MHLLLVGVPEDLRYQQRILEVTAGHRLQAILTQEVHELLSPILIKADKAGVEAILCSNPSVLKLMLAVQPTYTAPATRKQPSLDAFAGSMLQVILPLSKRQIPVLICNPFQQLVTVSYGKFLFQRYFSKLSKPDSWMKPLPFSWELVHAGNFASAYSYLSSCTLIGVDCETRRDGLQIDCISYCGWNSKENSCKTFLLPLASAETQETYLYNLSLAGQLNGLPVSKVLQNGGYDSAYFLRWGIPLHSYLWDTKHFFYCWYSELPKDLAYLTAFCLRDTRYWKDDGRTGDLKDYFEYCCRDSWSTLWTLVVMLREAPDWVTTNYLQEFPLVFPCLHVGLEGLAISEELWNQYEPKATEARDQSLAEIQACTGFANFNPGSSQQVVRLFEVLGCKDLKSSDKAATAKFSTRHPLNTRIAGLLRKYRIAAKELSTYWKKDKLLAGRVLYVLDPSGTDTARLASQEHSFWCGLQVQNIPPIFRNAVISDTNYYISSVDFPQSEARCVAYDSGDENLIETVESERDYHGTNVERFFGIPYEQVMSSDGHCINKPVRDLSKRVNHGSNYNMGEDMLLETMGEENVEKARGLLRLSPLLSLRQICGILLDRYAKAYPKVKGDWYTHIKHTIVATKRLVSSLGWTRYCFGHPDKNKRDLNAYVAHVPQNLSVSIINRCFHRIWRDIQLPATNVRPDGSLKLRLKAQIHDEVLFQYHHEHHEIPEAVRLAMIEPVQVTDCGGVTRIMLIPPPQAPLGVTVWGKLK